MIADLSPAAGRYLPLNYAALVPGEVVRISRGIDYRRFCELVDDGTFLWVWDFRSTSTTSGYKRELRFLANELCTPALYRKKTIDEVTTDILGQNRKYWSVSNFCILATLSYPHAYRLLEENQLTTVSQRNPKMISRESLAAFLMKRRIV